MSAAAIGQWLASEQASFAERHPRSRALLEAGQEHYLYGVPLHWMRRWTGGFPLYAERAQGATVHARTGTPTLTSASATPARCVGMRCRR